MKYCLSILSLLTSFVYSQSQIRSDKVMVDYGNTQLFNFMGHVHLEGTKIDLTADTLKYNSTNHRISSSGNLQLVLADTGVHISADNLARSKGTTQIFMKDPHDFVHSRDDNNARDILAHQIDIDDQSQGNQKIHFKGSPTMTSAHIKASSEDEFIYDSKTKETRFIGKSKIEDETNHNTIQSSNIIFSDILNKLIFHSAVGIIDKDSHYLTANTGEYTLDTQNLTLDKNVSYIGDIARISSDSLRTDTHVNTVNSQGYRVYFFEKNVHLTYQDFHGTSTQVMVSPDEHYTELDGNVHLKGTQGLSIDCNLMDIMEKEKKSYLYDHVVMMVGNKHFSGDMAIYDDVSKVFTIQGHAKFQSPENNYDAQIIYLDNTNLSVKFVGQVQGSSVLKGLKGVKVQTL